MNKVQLVLDDFKPMQTSTLVVTMQVLIEQYPDNNFQHINSGKMTVLTHINGLIIIQLDWTEF